MNRPSRKEPEGDGNCGGVKELGGEGDDAVDEVSLDDGFADVAFTGGVGGKRAVGHDKAGGAAGGEVVDEVLDPGVVGVAGGGDAVHPARVVSQAITTPIGHVEGGVGEDVIGFEVRMEVAVEGIGVFRAKVVSMPRMARFILARRQVVGLDSCRRRRGRLMRPPCAWKKFLGLDEHAAGAAAGVVNAAFVGGEHLDQDADNGAGGVELAAFFAFRTGKLTEEIFIDAPEDIAGAVGFVGQDRHWRAGRSVPRGAACRGGAGEVLGEDTFEGGVLLLDGDHGVINEGADVGLLGVVLQEGPTGNSAGPRRRSRLCIRRGPRGQRRRRFVRRVSGSVRQNRRRCT